MTHGIPSLLDVITLEMIWDPDQERVLHPGHADAHHGKASNLLPILGLSLMMSSGMFLATSLHMPL